MDKQVCGIAQALETVDCKNRAKLILQRWASLPDTFGDLEDVEKALLSASGSTYLCEQIFSLVKLVMSPYRSRLAADNFEVCVQQKIANYKPNDEALVEEKLEQ